MPNLALPPPLDRMVRAIHRHDLETLVGCFAEDYVNDTPAHPTRGFVGRDQVRRNWARIFATVPDVRASVLRSTRDGQCLWSEWELSGTRADATEFLMRGVLIMEVPSHSSISSARFYLEPVEHLGGGVDEAVRRVTDYPSHLQEPS